MNFNILFLQATISTEVYSPFGELILQTRELHDAFELEVLLEESLKLPTCCFSLIDARYSNRLPVKQTTICVPTNKFAIRAIALRIVEFETEDKLDFVRSLLRIGWNPNALLYGRFTQRDALLIAVLQDHWTLAELLLNHGALVKSIHHRYCLSYQMKTLLCHWDDLSSVTQTTCA